MRHVAAFGWPAVGIFEMSGPIRAADTIAFVSEEYVIRAAANQLQAAGFRILGISPQTINIAGSAVYEAAFGAIDHRRTSRDQVGCGRGGHRRRSSTAPLLTSGFIDAKGTAFADVLEGVAIEEPVYFMESAFAPTKAYWHLRMPGDVQLRPAPSGRIDGGTRARA